MCSVWKHCFLIHFFIFLNVSLCCHGAPVLYYAHALLAVLQKNCIIYLNALDNAFVLCVCKGMCAHVGTVHVWLFIEAIHVKQWAARRLDPHLKLVLWTRTLKVVLHRLKNQNYTVFSAIFCIASIPIMAFTFKNIRCDTELWECWFYYVWLDPSASSSLCTLYWSVYRASGQFSSIYQPLCPNLDTKADLTCICVSVTKGSVSIEDELNEHKWASSGGENEAK